jgi:hypothetical protein
MNRIEGSTHEATLNEKTCPIQRDKLADYSPLERLFGTLIPGMGFGQLALGSSPQESKNKFYNAISLTECHYLQILKTDYDRIFKA